MDASVVTVLVRASIHAPCELQFRRESVARQQGRRARAADHPALVARLSIPLTLGLMVVPANFHRYSRVAASKRPGIRLQRAWLGILRGAHRHASRLELRIFEP